jgi:hypothetical protein
MTTRQKIKKAVKEMELLCERNQFEAAGNIASENKSLFKKMIKENGLKSLGYAYEVCHHFNMTQTDCFNETIQ